MKSAFAELFAYYTSGKPLVCDLEINPYRCEFWPRDELNKINMEYQVQKYAPGYFGFATSGGGEMFAFAPDGTIVCLPFIGMEPSVALHIASSWPEFEGKLKSALYPYAQAGLAYSRLSPASSQLLCSTLDIMRNDQWKSFLLASRDVLGQGASNSRVSKSWCAWTTFTALKYGGIHYWTCGIPEYSEILDTHIEDGGLWGQPFSYDDLAHVVVPKAFYWETEGGPDFQNGTKTQNIEALSARLRSEGIDHRITDLVLEIKLY